MVVTTFLVDKECRIRSALSFTTGDRISPFSVEGSQALLAKGVCGTRMRAANLVRDMFLHLQASNVADPPRTLGRLFIT